MNDKNTLDNILELFYNKSLDNRALAIKKLEKYFQNHIDKSNLNNSLIDLISQIKNQILTGNFIQIIIKGDMTIFFSLFNIIKTYNNVKPEVYFSLIEPILDFLKHNDEKLVISSSDTLIKLLKSKGKIFISYFIILFEHLIILKQKKNQIVRNYGNALDEFLKDLIGNNFQGITKKKSNFDFPIDYLTQKLKEINHPAIKILIISWITFIISIPETNLISNYNKIIPKLFDLLTDQVKDVYQCSEQCLKKIYICIDIHFEEMSILYPKIMNELFEILIEICRSTYDNVKICAFEWLNLFLTKYKEIIHSYIEFNEINNNNKDNLKVNNNNNEKKDNKDSLKVNKDISENKEKNLNEINTKSNKNNNSNSSSFSRMNNNKLNDNYKNSIEYKNRKLLIQIGLMDKNEKIRKITPNELIGLIQFDFFSKILDVLIYNIILNLNIHNKNLVQNCNEIFQSIILIVPFDIFSQNIKKLEQILKSHLLSTQNDSGINLVLNWTLKLFKRFHFSMFNNIEDYLEKLTNIIPENNKEIFNKILNILCEIAKYDESFTFLIISLLIKKLEKSPNLINKYGISMLKILSTAIPITTIYLTITDILLKHNEIKFIIGMVNILDIFLLTEDGSEKVRIKLNKFNTKERKGDDFKFFNQIFNLLSYKPISALMMCIISNYYELSFYLALELVNMDLEIDDYFQLNQMIQLIESSLFHHIRIKLLNPNKNIFLIKTLYAILIILPRGHAFNALNNRLKSLKIISYLNNDQNLISKENAKDNLKLDEDIKNEVNSFIKIFKERQDIKNYK